MMTNVKRPAIRYYGSKWRLAPWLINQFPKHEVYVEPFAGSAAVLLRKSRSLLEVLNDLDYEVVNFFFCLRELGNELVDLIYLTPFSNLEFINAQSFGLSLPFSSSSSSPLPDHSFLHDSNHNHNSTSLTNPNSLPSSSSLIVSPSSLSSSLSLLFGLVEAGVDLKSVRSIGSHKGKREREKSSIAGLRAAARSARSKGSHGRREAAKKVCLEAARKFYVRSYLSIAGPTSTWQSGYRRQKVYSRGREGQKTMSPASETFAKVEHLPAIIERLKGVNIDKETGLECIARYDSEKTLFYVDPPYVQETRERWKADGYRHEMNEFDHEELLAKLAGVKGKVVISGYRSELYDDSLGGWERREQRARINGEGSAVESIWLNKAAVEEQQQMRLL